MTKPIYVLNGPNLNLLGKREPEIYGHQTLQDIAALTNERARDFNLDCEFRQSNVEGELVNWVQEAREKGSGIIMNAAGFTHTSVALLDALQAAEVPVIEVHLSNIFRREDYRHHSFVSKAATGVICGLGATGYRLAIEAMAGIIEKKDR